MQLAKIKQKERLLSHQETDGEGKIFLKISEIRSLPKTYSFKVQQVVERPKQQEGQQNQLKPHFQESKQQNILRLAMQAKMQTQSLKIRTLFKLNLAKVGINNFKQRYDRFLKSCQQKILEEVYKQILYALVNSDLDKEIEEQKLKNLKNGLYDDRTITIMPGWVSENLLQLGYELPFFPTRPITKTIKEAIPFLLQSHSSKLKNSFHNNFDLQKQAIRAVQQQGIVYLDEIDKLITPEGTLTGTKGVSTEGVQRDLLPILQGTYVSTKFGQVRTDHILFIASGSFSMSKVQDLMPELLGRLPVRVSLHPITLQDFYRILTEPENNILSQQISLLKTEQVELNFEQDAIRKIAQIAFELNQSTQNLGARRLQSLVQKILQDISFIAPQKKGQKISITKEYVLEKLEKMKSTINLSKYLI